jgi:DNA-directed RNA polymerase specialized sigma subunit
VAQRANELIALLVKEAARTVIPQAPVSTTTSPQSLRERQLQMWTDWQKTQNDADLEPLLDSLQPIILQHINQYARSPIPFSAIQMQANIFAREALKGYNPTKSAVATHVRNAVGFGMPRWIQSNQNAKYLPAYLSGEFGRYENTRKVLEQKLGRQPSDEEVGIELGLKPDKVRRIRFAMQPESMLSIDIESGEATTPVSQAEQRHRDAVAYLQKSVKGSERKALLLMLGSQKQDPITDSSQLAKMLKLKTEDIYNYRRRWTKMLKDSGML